MKEIRKYTLTTEKDYQVPNTGLLFSFVSSKPFNLFINDLFIFSSKQQDDKHYININEIRRHLEDIIPETQEDYKRIKISDNIFASQIKILEYYKDVSNQELFDSVVNNEIIIKLKPTGDEEQLDIEETYWNRKK